MIKNCQKQSKLFKNGHTHSKWSKTVNVAKSSKKKVINVKKKKTVKMVKRGQKTVKNGQQRPTTVNVDITVKTSQKWSKMVSKMVKMVKSGQNG